MDNRILFACCITVWMGACAEEGQQVGQSSSLVDDSDASTDAVDASIVVDGVRAELVSGVWIFSRTRTFTENRFDNDHWGTVLLTDKSCLGAGEAVVVWSSEELDHARELVTQALAGEAPQVHLGGLLSLPTRGNREFYDFFSGRCGTDRVAIQVSPPTDDGLIEVQL